jgi:hypothetical protein
MIYATLNIDEDISEVFENRRIVNDHQGLWVTSYSLNNTTDSRLTCNEIALLVSSGGAALDEGIQVAFIARYGMSSLYLLIYTSSVAGNTTHQNKISYKKLEEQTHQVQILY